MTRTASILMTAVMLVATVGALPVIGAATAGFAGSLSSPDDRASNVASVAANETDVNGTNASVPPGAMLSGSLGVQKAELEGEVETRAFGLAVARAATNTSKVEVVRQQVDHLRERLQGLQQRKQALEQARENGSISNATYKARIAELAARTTTVRALANMSTEAAQGLPEDLLASKGINVTAIQTLKHNAANLTGPQVAAIARSIAGPDLGRSIARQKAPVDIGPPEDVPGGNETGPPEDARGNQTAGNETRGGSGQGGGAGDGGSGNGGGSGSGDGQGGTGSGAGDGEEGTGSGSGSSSESGRSGG